MNTDKLPNTIKTGFDAVIAFFTGRPFIEYTTLTILVVGVITKVTLWKLQAGTLVALGLGVHIVLWETLISMPLGGTLLWIIARTKQRYSNDILFWSSAALAVTYSCAILLVLLVLGLKGMYFGDGSSEQDLERTESSQPIETEQAQETETSS